MVLVSDLITQVRDILDEAVAGQWTDAMLVRWMNEGARDLGRSTRHLKGKVVQAVTGGTGEYPLAATVVAVEHAYWTPTGDTLLTPLVPKHYESMDEIWGSWQNRESSNPSCYTTMGMTPAAIVQLWPIPEGNGNLTMIVSRLHTEMATAPVVPAATADVPALWYDAINDWCEYRALRRDRDPRSMEALETYNTKRDALTQNTDFLAENREVVPVPEIGGYLPMWLVAPDY